ncbi:MAG: hypothetical protein ACE5FT_01245 [Candidatus Nanoarchaeia archaeon]
MKIKKGTVVMDLTLGEEALWKKVDKKNRWSVNKAKKAGVYVRECDADDKERCY